MLKLPPNIKGISILELLVALGIGAFVIKAVTDSFKFLNQASTSQITKQKTIDAANHWSRFLNNRLKFLKDLTFSENCLAGTNKCLQAQYLLNGSKKNVLDIGNHCTSTPPRKIAYTKGKYRNSWLNFQQKAWNKCIPECPDGTLPQIKIRYISPKNQKARFYLIPKQSSKTLGAGFCRQIIGSANSSEAFIKLVFVNRSSNGFSKTERDILVPDKNNSGDIKWLRHH